MKCDCCKKEVESLFLIKIIGLGDKEVCAECYLKMLPNPDRTVKEQ